MRSLTLSSALFMFLLAGTAAAQVDSSGSGNTVPQLQNPADETIEIGLSTETIAITSNFGGTDLTIFGALDNADPMVQRQGRYDIIVVLQGPSRDLVVRKKDRYLGVWVNADSETFMGVPLSYSLASTRNLQDITEEKIYRQLSVGARNFYLVPEDPGSLSGNIPTFGNELREMKIRQGLYTQRIGGVEFISRTLFRATLKLPANVPVGRHKARALLFRNGVFLREANASLEIVKAGFEQSIYNAAHQNSFLYGLLRFSLPSSPAGSDAFCFAGINPHKAHRAQSVNLALSQHIGAQCLIGEQPAKGSIQNIQRTRIGSKSRHDEPFAVAYKTGAAHRPSPSHDAGRRMKMACNLALPDLARWFMPEGKRSDCQFLHAIARQVDRAIRIVIAGDPEPVAVLHKGFQPDGIKRWQALAGGCIVKTVAKADDGSRLIARDGQRQHVERRRCVIRRDELAAPGKG